MISTGGGNVSSNICSSSLTAIVPLDEARTIVLTPASLRRLAKHAACPQVDLVHRGRILVFTRDFARKMEDRRDIFYSLRDIVAFVTEPSAASTPASFIHSGTREAITRKFFSPASRNCRTMCVPRKPVPPVIRIFFSAFVNVFFLPS